MNAPHPLPDLTAPALLRPARRAASATSSIVREILKVALRPDMISLAGGLPAPESFPVEALRGGIRCRAA
jgi:2-aminoadipate transaminase